MFFRRVKYNQNKLRERYLCELQDYLKYNSFVIVQRIKNGMLSSKNIGKREIKLLLGYDYPKAGWISSEDDVSQLICLFKEIGYSNITRNSYGCRCNVNEMCEAIIKNYIKVNREEIMDRLASCCALTLGRVSYNQMKKVLGFDSSKIDKTSREDINVCILMFLKGTEIPFKYNDTHIYLP